MKTLILATACALGMGLALPAAAKGSHRVAAHTTKSGTYVPSHRATNPDSTKTNNYSTKGNVNPHTGKAGTKSP